jgi:hypothetical protein
MFFLLRTGDLLVAGPSWQPAMGERLITLNRMLSGTLVLICIVVALLCVYDLRRFWRRFSGHDQTAAMAS